MPLLKRSLVDCLVSRPAGFNGFGQPIVGTPVKTKCAVVKHEIAAQQSTVRADSSSTKGHATEEIANFIGLFPTQYIIKLNDIVELYGVKFKVTSIEAKVSVMGKVDHNEVKGMIHE